MIRLARLHAHWLVKILTAVFGWPVLLSCVITASAGEIKVQNNPKKIDVVVIGASYAAGWKVDELTGLTVLNKGVGGQESHEMLARFERDVVAQMPRFVIIWGFINDIFRAQRDRLPERLERTKQDLRAMVDLAQTNGIQPILATEVTTAEPGGIVNTLRGWLGRLRGKQSYAQFISKEVMTVNEWLRRYAAEKGVPLLDIERLFAGPDGLRLRDYTAEDGSHITRAGYQALTEHARMNLPRLLGDR